MFFSRFFLSLLLNTSWPEQGVALSAKEELEPTDVPRQTEVLPEVI